MTNEEIRAAIERLKAIPCDGMPAAYSVASAFMDMEINVSYSDIGLRNRLIALLRQADPETHMELPVDADGEVIHVGDKLVDYETPRTVSAVSSDSVCLCGYHDGGDWCRMGIARNFKHYRKPTVEDVLREFGDEVRRCCDTEDTITEYAAKLREVMADE